LSVAETIMVPMTTILVPPLLCSPKAYAPVLDAVWSFGPVTFADTRNDDTIAGMAARLLRDAPDRFTLLGTSMGGYVALEVMRQAPERVRALCLVSTSARADTPEQIAARQRQSRLVEGGQFDALVDAAFAGVVAADNETDQGLLTSWRAMTVAVGPAVFLRQQAAAISRVDSRALLASIVCPTTVIHGAGDRLIPVEMGRELAASIPDAELVVIEGAGHLAFSEQPAAAEAAVSDFLARAADQP
jgi:pimeloyl-ACP methyl ester carboxylesterase